MRVLMKQNVNNDVRKNRYIYFPSHSFILVVLVHQQATAGYSGTYYIPKVARHPSVEIIASVADECFKVRPCDNFDHGPAQ